MPPLASSESTKLGTVPGHTIFHLLTAVRAKATINIITCSCLETVLCSEGSFSGRLSGLATLPFNFESGETSQAA